ncbi:unnamed protein product, partial [Ectocarpus sp. 12 AP-2014]
TPAPRSARVSFALPLLSKAMLRCAASSPAAERVRGAARRFGTKFASQGRLLHVKQRHHRRTSGLTALLLDRDAAHVAAIARVAPVSNGFCTAKRRLPHAQGATGCGGRSSAPFLFNRTATAARPMLIHRPRSWNATTAGARRQLSTPGRGGRPLPERVFAGLVVVVLAAWGLVFGAITLLLLPFVGIGLFLLRRNFQRGGMSRNLVARLAQKMAERGGPHGGGGGLGGPMMGGGGGAPRMQRAPTEGALSSLFAQMLGGGIRGMQLVGVLRSEVEKRALRHPGLSSALGGGIEIFSDIEISTVDSVGGNSWNSGGGAGDRQGGEPSRVTKAKLRFSGRRAGAGWAEVEVTEWGGRGEEEGMEFDRIFVTLDNGRTFDLTSDSFSGDDRVGEGASGVRSRRTVKGRSTSPQGSKNKARGEARGGQPVEAEFRDK